MSRNSAVVAFALLAAAGSANAQITTFFGEDAGQGENVRLASFPNATAARTSFFSNLINVGTENFESFANGQAGPLGVNFGVAGTATLAGGGNISNVPTGTNGVGRYPISGNQFWETSSANFTLSFSQPIAAFGFYGIDVGDFNGQLQLTLSSGVVEVVNVGNSIGSVGGGVLYFGLIRAGGGITSIAFGNTGSGADFFGFDDFSIGTVEQVQVIPLPPAAMSASASLLGLGAISAFRRRRQG